MDQDCAPPLTIPTIAPAAPATTAVPSLFRSIHPRLLFKSAWSSSSSSLSNVLKPTPPGVREMLLDGDPRGERSDLAGTNEAAFLINLIRSPCSFASLFHGELLLLLVVYEQLPIPRQYPPPGEKTCKSREVRATYYLCCKAATYNLVTPSLFLTPTT